MSTKTCAPDELGLYWQQDTISEADTDSSDVIYEGSDDEYYTSPEARQQACVAAGYRYLQGRPPVLLSSTLHGPFDSRSGWRSPWGSRTQALSQKAIHKQASTNKHSDSHAARRTSNKSTRKRAQPEHSQESHLPSPESLKQASAASTPHQWDDDELVHTETWVNDVCEGETLGSATKSRENSTTRKRKSKRSESVRNDMTKRRKTGQDHNGQHTSPIRRAGLYSLSQPPRRGCRAAFDDPITLSFASAPGQMQSHSSQPASEYHRLARGLRRTKSSQPLFLGIPETRKSPTLTSPPKRSCPIKAVKREHSDDANSWGCDFGMPSPSSPCSHDLALDTELPTAMPPTKEVMPASEPADPKQSSRQDPSTSNDGERHQAQQDEGDLRANSSKLDVDMDSGSAMVEATTIEDVEAECCHSEEEGVTSDHAIADAVPWNSSEADDFTSTEDDIIKAELQPQPSLPALPSASMSLDQLEEDVYEQASIDAMVLDQLTQSTYAHVSMTDAANDLRSTLGAEDIFMRASESTEQRRDKAHVIEPEDGRTTSLEEGVSEGDTFAVSSDQLQRGSEVEGVDRVTYAEHLTPGAGGDVPHFSFSALVSKLVPTNSWVAMGTLGRSRGSELCDGEHAKIKAAVAGIREDVRTDVSQPVASSTSTGAEVDISAQEQEHTLTATEEAPGAQVELSGSRVQAEDSQLREMHPKAERIPSPSPQLPTEEDVSMTSATNIGAEVSDTPAEVKMKLIETIEGPAMADVSMASVGQTAETLTTSRSKTPEPLFCIKSMASFMSPSPKRKPRRRSDKASGSAGVSSIAKSALKCPWAAPKAKRQVTWAPLPDENDSHGAQRLRQASPPPESTIDMGTEPDAKFQQHFSAVNRRSSGRHQKRRLGSDQIQRLDGPSVVNYVTDAVTTKPVAVDAKLEVIAANFPVTTEEEDVDMEREDSEEPMDIVEDVFQEMSQLLRTWDVDAEIEAARMQPSTAVVEAQAMF